MNRRQLIILLSGAMPAPSFSGNAQPANGMRRIGVLMSTTVTDSNDQGRRAAFQQGLQQLGWNDGANVRIDYRWGAGNADDIRKYAAELVALAPDVILAGPGTVELMLQATRAVPV